MRIIIHFGTHKTGTTSIQQSFHASASTLANLLYPNFGKRSHNAALNKLFLGKRPNSAMPMSRTSTANLGSMLKDALDRQEPPPSNLLISAEDLTLFSAENLEAFYRELRTVSEEIIAVAYIRSPKRYVESMFQQQIKSGRMKQFAPQTVFPMYKDMIIKFDNVFGRENVYLWKYASEKFPNKCVVTDFCRRIDIDPSTIRISRANTGLSIEALSLLYAYARYGVALRRGTNIRNNLLLRDNLRVQKALRVGLRTQTKWAFSDALFNPILSANRDQIEWAEGRLGQSLADDGITDEVREIGDEEDLLVCDPSTLTWLCKTLEEIDKSGKVSPPNTPEEVALLMHRMFIALSETPSPLVT